MIADGFEGADLALAGGEGFTADHEALRESE
jgi:hypothetical protein